MTDKLELTPGEDSGPAIHLKLSLIENFYSFLNQSLRHYRKTPRNIREWPFALLHITQSIELMLKQVLRNIHRTLIFEDIDQPKHTVSLELALTRLEAFGVAVDNKEKVNIRRAANLRNQIVHYELLLNKFECKKVYAQLFEFVHYIHQKRLRKEIHSHVARENWPVEARLMTYFNKDFVFYNGIQMHKDNPKDILDAQRVPFFIDGRDKYPRIRYGHELGWAEWDPTFAEVLCHDCYIVKEQFHVEGCDVEQCANVMSHKYVE